MNEIKKGTHVRVTHVRDGVVERVYDDGTLLLENGSVTFLGDSIEVIAPPPPQYEVGAVYQMRENGCTYVRAQKGWRHLIDDMLYQASHDINYPAEQCTFVKLVPEQAA